MVFAKFWQKKSPVSTTDSDAVEASLLPPRNKRNKRNKKGQFGKGNNANPRGRPKVVKVEPGGAHDGFVPLLELVKRSALRGSVRHQEMFLKYSGGDQAPAVIHLYMPLADAPGTYKEGDDVPAPRDETTNATVPPDQYVVTNADPMLPELHDTNEPRPPSDAPKEPKQAARSLTELIEPTTDALHATERRKREQAEAQGRRNAMHSLGMDASEPQTGFGSEARRRLNGKVTR